MPHKVIGFKYCIWEIVNGQIIRSTTRCRNAILGETSDETEFETEEDAINYINLNILNGEHSGYEDFVLIKMFKIQKEY